jgi:hypothetical protein
MLMVGTSEIYHLVYCRSCQDNQKCMKNGDKIIELHFYENDWEELDRIIEATLT